MSISGCSALAIDLDSKLSDLQFRTAAVHCSGQALRCLPAAYSLLTHPSVPDLLPILHHTSQGSQNSDKLPMAQCHCLLRRVRLEQQTQEGAAKALAALRYEEQCEVQQLSEPASALSFLAHGTTDGVPLPDPGVALLVVRSSCPSNAFLSVQVSPQPAVEEA